MNIQDLFLQSPILVAVVTVLMIVGLHYQNGLTYREFMTLHTLKRKVFPVLDSYARKNGRPLVRTYNHRGESLSFVRTDNRTPSEVSRELFKDTTGHLIATLKRRSQGGEWAYAHSQFVVTHDDGMQTEIFLFRNPDYTTDIYAHLETSVSDPVGHLSDEQTSGDPKGVVTEALA